MTDFNQFLTNKLMDVQQRSKCGTLKHTGPTPHSSEISNQTKTNCAQTYVELKQNDRISDTWMHFLLD